MSVRPDNDNTRQLAAEIVSSGGLIAFRTDTFYGLGADPLNVEAIKRIKRIKGRDDGKPILLLISDLSDVESLISSKPQLFRLLAGELWPGPLTIVLPASADLPDEVTAGSGSIGIRLPDDVSLRELVFACGGRLTATSANPSGRPAAKSAVEVADYFPRDIDLIIDGGDVTVMEASSVVDVTCDPPRIIREGAVARSELERVLGRAM